ncbi:uncharacterized protein LOC143608649 isoform X2 [Bidens hawaiensis]|uniref:uncharacterized protein LOC143608649 isoform X2 n=1 Tax=Bidens hawaiensis TaxID=980011 RepID=UPI00404B420B
MDLNSVLTTTHHNSQTLTSSNSKSKSNTTTKQQQQQQPYITGNTNTHITTSINELRSFSTALSAFIRSYDELNNHIGFINSSIDGNLPPNCFVEERIVINPRYCDRTVNDVTVGVVSVRNPRDRVGECELRHAGASSRGFDETDVSKNRVEIDSLNSGFAHGYDELDASKKHEVASNRVEIDTRGRDIDVCKNRVEIDSLNSGYDELDALKKPVADNDEEIDTRGRDIDVFKKRVEIDSLNNGFSHGYDELDASKKVEVADESEEDPEEIELCENHVDVEIGSLKGSFTHNYDELDALKKVEVADESEEDPEEIEVCENHVDVEIDSLQKLEVANNPVEIDIDVFKNFEEVDVCENHVEIDCLNMQEETVSSSSCDETMAVVREAVVSEENLTGMVANGKRSNENVRTPECFEKINVSVPKKVEQSDIVKKPEEDDICRNAEETVMVKKLEEFDTVLETSCDQKSIAIVSERKHKVMAMRIPVSFEEVDVLKKPAAIDMPKKVEVTDICKKSEQIDLSLEPEELDTSMIREEVGALKKHDDVDILMKPEETDTSKKPEESLPETSCDQTITTVPEAIASDQNHNQMATDCEQSHENVSTPENLEETGIYKNPKETVVLEKSEKTDTSKKRQKNGTCKKGKKPKALKKSVVSNGKQSHEKVRAPEHLQEIDILNKPEQTDICKNPEESTVSKKPEELDIANPEESLPETSCDHTTIAVQEAIESEQTPNTVAANDKLSHKIVMTPECHEETDVSVRKKPEQTAVLKKPKQTDILNKLEETVVSKKLKRVDTLKKHEENGTCKKAKETKAHTETAVSEAIVSEQNPNRMAANDKPSHENVMTPEWLEETEVSAPKKPEQTVASKKPRQTVSSKKPEQTIEAVASKKPEQAVASKKPEQAVASKKPEQAVASKKPEQAVTSKKLEQAVASKKPEQAVASKKPEQTGASKKPEQTGASKKPEQTGILNKPEQTVVSEQVKKITTLKKHEENGTCKKAKETEAPKKFVISMLESLCRGMCYKDMKFHVASHYSEMINCREEIAKSLKLAKDPAKLVLYSIGRFFIQDSKTFCNPHQKESQRRMASVLILECFVMISRDDGIEIAKREQQYAAEAAVDWKKRMIREGGLRQADEVDARGLLLLISGFGIEDHVFKIRDIIHLIRVSNVKGIATALRRSAFLIPKITEVIYSLVNNGLEIEAVDITYTFGLEHTCHPEKILTAYLQNKIKDFQNASSLQMLEATKQHIFDLTLVKQCLESHNVDPSTLLPAFKINERIQILEKEVNEWKLIHKRKSQENSIHPEPKRACYVHEPVDHYGMDRFNRSTQPSTSYVTKHPASPVYNAYARPENRNGSVPNGQAGGYRGSYNQTMYTANNQSYGQHYPRHDQTYGSQPDHRPWDQKQLESFPGFLGSQPPSSDLYGFAKLVEKGWRGSRA